MVSVVLKNSGQVVRLGRRIPTVKRYCLPLAAFLDSSRLTVPIPSICAWQTKAARSLKRMYGNDRYGDCVIAGKYHSVGVLTANDGVEVEGTDTEVINAYHSICGPGDNGCYITDVLDAFRSRGLSFNGKIHKIEGYVGVDHRNKELAKMAIFLFGGLTIGLSLPDDWTCTNCVWDVTDSPIVGGHDVEVIGYNEVGVQLSTWAGLVTMTWNAFLSNRWIDEAYCKLAPDWYGNDNLTPSGLDVEALREALRVVSGDDPPRPPPPPPPPPVPDFPPWLLAVLKALCSRVDLLPAPWNAIAKSVCDRLPSGAAGDCGCGGGSQFGR